MYIVYLLICDTFCLTSFYVFIYEFIDLPLFVVVKALPSLCCVIFHIYDVKVERTGAVVKPRTLGQEVPGSSLSRVAVRCGLEQVTFPHLLR